MKKKEKANAEIFNSVAMLKGKLQAIHGLIVKLIKEEDGMRKSLKEENQKDASCFKKQRDIERNDVIKALNDSEQPQHYTNDNVISTKKEKGLGVLS